MTLPLRVLMTADTVGGVWTYALDLARALEPHGVEIALATMGAPLSERQLEEVSALPNVQLHESRFQLEWMDEPWRDVELAGDWLLQIASEFQPDLVHLNGYAHGALPWNAPVLMVAHSCVLSWWRAVKGEEAPDRYREYAERVREGLDAADLVVAPSEAMLEALCASWPVERARSRVIANGRDPLAFYSGHKEPFVFTAGRIWDEAKNILFLDQLAPHLDWSIVAAGDAVHPNGYLFRAERLQFTGKLSQPEMAQWLARASIFAAPARYEPFGLSILEAALSGCALVLGDIPSLRELWSDAALFVPPDDPKAWREALDRLIAEPGWRRQLGSYARRRGLYFTAELMAENYLAAYRSLLSPDPQPSLIPTEPLELAG